MNEKIKELADKYKEYLDIIEEEFPSIRVFYRYEVEGILNKSEYESISITTEQIYYGDWEDEDEGISGTSTRYLRFEDQGVDEVKDVRYDRPTRYQETGYVGVIDTIDSVDKLRAKLRRYVQIKNAR